MRRALAATLGALLIGGSLAEDTRARAVQTAERTAAVALPAPRLDGGVVLGRVLAIKPGADWNGTYLRALPNQFTAYAPPVIPALDYTIRGRE